MSSFIEEVMRLVLPHPSAWRLASSGGGEVSVGLEKFLYIAGTGGTFYMGMGSSSHAYPFTYVGVGGGAGVGLSTLAAVAGSFSASTFPSTGGEFGRLYLPPWSSTDVNIDSISGPAVLISTGISLIGGAYLSAVFFGAQLSTFMGMPNPASVLMSADAVAFQAGTAITTSYGAGVTGYELYITGHGRMS